MTLRANASLATVAKAAHRTAVRALARWDRLWRAAERAKEAGRLKEAGDLDVASRDAYDHAEDLVPLAVHLARHAGLPTLNWSTLYDEARDLNANRPNAEGHG